MDKDTMMDREALGRRIVLLRKQKGISQKELAERLQVSPSAVCKWEGGQNSPDILMAKNIADVLGVSCDELLGEPQKSRGRTSEKTLVCMALTLVLLAATLFVVVCMDKGKETDRTEDAPLFRIVKQNYAEDAEEGKVYELSIVYDGVPGEEDIFAYMSEISEDYRKGSFGDLEASVIKCIFYDSEDAAQKGENTWIVSFLHL